jgi:replicative DNA helicase
MKDNITEYMQENLLNILIKDDKNYKLIIDNLEVNYFESSYYRSIFNKVKSYILRFKETPKLHIFELLDKEINDKKIYKDIIENIINSEINAEYVIGEYLNFIRQQQLKIGIISAAEKIENSDIVGAEKCLNDLRNSQIKTFDKGSNLDLSFIDEDDLYHIPTGIKPIDDIKAMPTKKELYSLIALPNTGKSQFLIHLGKVAMMTKHKVIHISLEMSENKVKQRYVQSLFNVSKRESISVLNRFTIDDKGYLLNHDTEEVLNKLSFDNKNICDTLNKKISKLPVNNLIIKEFAGDSLSISKLTNYLDNLIDDENFHPDIILLDYPAKMRIENPHKIREELGRIYIQLRGIAVKYNLAMVIVAQINREGKKEKVSWLNESYLQEDFSLTNEADTIISLNQTEYEYNSNMARLYLCKSRNDVKYLKILLSQNYNCCQFAIDAVKLNNNNYKIKE